MTRGPVVSVVVPAFNAAPFVAEAIASARAQTGATVQVVVVDDGSTDATAAVVDDLAGDDLVVVRQANAGPAAARNRALERVTGELVAFLDADDVWPRDKLALQMAVLDERDDVDVVLGRTRFFGDLDEVHIRFEGDDRLVLGSFLGAGLYRRRVVERVGGFDESLRTGEDYDWFLRAREAGVRILVIEAVTLCYRVHPGGVSRDEVSGNRNLAEVLHRSLARRRVDGGVGSIEPLDGAVNRRA